MAKNPTLIDLTGETFGDWLVLGQGGNAKGGAALWRCLCACGRQGVARGSDLRARKSQNCGCRKAARIGSLRRTHGQSGTRLHSIWKLMRARCEREGASGFAHYGARGVEVCPEWQDFDAFFQWARESGYRDDLTIDRIDNSKGYEPANCRWADWETQAANRSISLLTSDGRLGLHVARENGIPDHTYRVRIHSGWSIDRAATQPYRTRKEPRRRGAAGKFI